jgi:TolA-binding protein
LRRPTDQEDHYQLGYAYFKSGNYSDAVNSFQKAVGDSAALSQSAYYYIGSAELKSDRKLQAKTAFKKASEYDQDQTIKEDAWFNYAKLAYELSYHPYDDAILAFEEFIEKYPNSTKLDDAYEYLLRLASEMGLKPVKKTK